MCLATDNKANNTDSQTRAPASPSRAAGAELGSFPAFEEKALNLSYVRSGELARFLYAEDVV